MLPPINPDDLTISMEQEFQLAQISSYLNNCQDLTYLRQSIIELTKQTMVYRKVIASMTRQY